MYNCRLASNIAKHGGLVVVLAFIDYIGVFVVRLVVIANIDGVMIVDKRKS